MVSKRIDTKKIWSILIFILLTDGFAVASETVYPAGNRFPLGLYSIHDAEEMQSVKSFGWNIAHTYHFQSAFLQTCFTGGMLSLAHLPGKSELIPEAQAAQTIPELAVSNSIAWWDLPEERRWWRTKEMTLIANYCKWTRRYDPKKRPNYMYIPGHYSVEDIAKYVPYLDVIPASVYTTYCGMPHAWVRWRMETTVKAIEFADFKLGANYLKGEKTPVAVLELFYGGKKGNPVKIMTPEGAYHDFWQCIVSGARGILIFSYWHKRDKPQYEKNWQAYCRAASQITGKERLGQMVLYGKKLPGVRCEILKGPRQTREFLPHGTKLDKISFSSIDFLAKAWGKNIYIIVVNSVEETVSVRISGLPDNAAEAVILFKNRMVPIKDEPLMMSLRPLEVSILKVPSQRASM